MVRTLRFRTVNRRATIGFALVLMCLSFPLTADGMKITIRVTGYGGIRINPPAICPNPSPATCFSITIESTNPIEGIAEDPLTSYKYRVIFSEPIPPEVTEISGADLPIETIEPIE